MTTMTSACGIYDCKTCNHFAENKCPGCENGNQHQRSANEETCKVFECVSAQGIKSCDQCKEPSCSMKRSVEALCPLRSKFVKPRWWAGRMARAMESRGRDETNDEQPSEKVIHRLRLYLTALDSLHVEGRKSVSSWQLAEKVGISAALIRKDLSRFGEFGTPSHGYDIQFLQSTIRGILRLNKRRKLIWIGAGCLQHHARTVEKLSHYGCEIVGVFDPEINVSATASTSFLIQHLDALQETLRQECPSMAVIGIAGADAQKAANLLVENGVNTILNISGELLMLPEHVRVSSLDVLGELIELAYYS